MKKFIVFVQKEFFHILRDKRTMLILLAMPVIMIILFGYAITTEVKNSRVAVLDMSHDQVTQQMVQHIAANKYFTLVANVSSQDEVQHLFLSGKIDLAIEFSENFAAEMKQTGNASIQILADGSEPNQASVRTGYTQQILAGYLQDYAAQHGMRANGYTITPVSRMLFNPQTKSEYNFVPAVIGMILLLICAMMTSVAIVKEKETGTMEILLASPLPPAVIVLAKLVPYFIISMVNITTILLLSYFLLGVPMAGSLAGFIGISMIYILVGLALGLFISTCVNSQMAAMLLSLLMIVPTMYLSGMAFAIESMPVAAQNASAIIPARWYMDAARRIMIQGVELRYVLKDTVILVVMAVVLMSSAWGLFKTRLE